MDLSQACKEHWGFQPIPTPFGKTIRDAEGVFVWPAFDAVVRRIIRAIEWRRFLVVVGAACSAKSTAWSEARRRLSEKNVVCHICQPLGLDPSQYGESAIYSSLVQALAVKKSLARSREGRAYQCRQLLEAANAGGEEKKQSVAFAVNDAHLACRDFLLMTKRLWDDLYGFDRLLAVILIGQPSLLSEVSDTREMAERAEVVELPGLGDSLSDYLAHECARCGAHEMPFDEGAIRVFSRLKGKDWQTTLDHPLIVNNVASRALHLAHKIKAPVVDADCAAKAMRQERGMLDDAREGKEID